MKNITLVEITIAIIAVAFLVACFMSTTFLYGSVTVILVATAAKILRDTFKGNEALSLKVRTPAEILAEAQRKAASEI